MALQIRVRASVLQHMQPWQAAAVHLTLRSGPGLSKMLKTAKFEDKALLKRSSSIGANGNARLAAAALRLPSVDSDSMGAVLQFVMFNGLSLPMDDFVQLCGQPVDCEDWDEARETCGKCCRLSRPQQRELRPSGRIALPNLVVGRPGGGHRLKR